MEKKFDMPHLQHLAQDAKLAPLLETLQPYELEKKTNTCLRLCASIMSQQLSTKVAAVIYNRFLGLYEGGNPTPVQIIETPFETLRAIGLSNAKVNYVQNVAQHFLEKKATDESVNGMSDTEVVEFLLPIKGVGRWTIEMLLMFTLGREDIFAVDDLGIQQAMAKIYNLDSTNKKAFKQQMIDISATWAPYRTYACFYLWKFKDSK